MPVGFKQKAIAPKKSFGTRLREVRESRNLSLDQAELETKIRSRYLTALEDGRYEAIPESHARGFIRGYAEYLRIPADVIEQELELFTLHRAKRHPFSPAALDTGPRWIVTPRVVATVCSIVVLIGFIGYVTYQVRQFAAPPALTITKPANESAVASETVTIEGRTDPGSLVLIDNLQAGVGSDGTFAYPVTLRPGLNRIAITAENRIKKRTTQSLSLLYQAPVLPESVSPTPEPSASLAPDAEEE